MMKEIKNIKPNYKQTPVGIIPKDWEVKNLGYSLKGIVGGGTPSRTVNEYWNGDIPWATVKDFRSFNPEVTQEYITDLGLKNSSSNLVSKGTLITATRMGLGRVCVYNVDVAINQDLKALKLKDNINRDFLYYWFLKNGKYIESLGTGSTVKGITLGDLKGIKFIQVPLVEQEQIAACLTTWDQGIEKLSTLIEAKKQQKKGVMQRLLTGKKRLPGFTAEWQEVRLGEISIKKSSSLQANSIIENSGDYNVYGATGFLTKIDSYDEKQDYIGIVKDGSGVGNMYLLEGKSSVLGTLDRILPKDSNLYFLYGLLKRVNFIKYKVGGAIPHIYYKDYSNEIVLIPSLEEQIAIAQILSMADQEIDLLEKKLETIQLQKKGLMQVLLTGKKRLV